MSSEMRPSEPVGRPGLERRVHVSPASVDFQMPLPGPPPFMQHALRRRWYVEAYRILALVGSITRSFAPVSSSTVRTAFHVLPPSVVLNTPRSPPGPHRLPVAATNTTSLFRGSMTMRLMK